MRLIGWIAVLLAGQAHAQTPAEYDPADFGKIVISARQSTDGLTFEQAFGDYQNEPVVDYGPDGPAVKMGRPIGRLDLLYETGKPGFCTAFIVDVQHIVTNHHCIPGMDGDPTGAKSGVTAAQFVAGYINPGRAVGVDKYTVSPQIVETNRELDYTVLKVFGDPSAKYGMMKLADADPGDAEFLWIIGHPEGQSQHISREGCAAASPALSAEGKLVHTCDTLQGNSGSPVIRITDQRVVGLHHAGNNRTGFNQAIPMRRILSQSKVLKASLAPGSNSVTPPANGQAQACTALWTEAKGMGCVGYKAYVAECGDHTFAGLAKGFIADECAAVEPKPAPVVATPSKPTAGAITVKAEGGGDFRDLRVAVLSAQPEDVIEVYPGTYTTGISVDKPLSIHGVGNRSDIILKVEDETGILWTAASGSIRNLTILLTGGKKFAVKFQGGSAVMEECDVSSRGLAAVAITDGGNPVIANNRIHDAAQSGIFIYDAGQGWINGNVIENNGLAGIAFSEGANPKITDNDIRGNTQAGIKGYEDVTGTIEGNRITGNGKAGINMKINANPVVTGNTISKNGESGVFLHEGSLGTISGNLIEGNSFAGIAVREKSKVVIENNEIRHNSQSGIYIQKDATGTFTDNTVIGNGYAGIDVKLGANPLFRGNMIRDNSGSGVYVHDDGKGVFENNQITGNGKFGVSIKTKAAPVFRDNIITGNAFHAIWVRESGSGTFERNNLRNNGRGTFRIDSDAGKVTRSGNRE